MAQKALITGASSGIGKELAMVMAENGHDLVLVARKKKDLEKVKDEIAEFSDVKVSVYESDLAQPGSGKKLYDQTKKENIEILVNNAGVGYKGNFFDDDLERHQQLVQLNMTTLMDLSFYFGGDFVKAGSGRILNTTSIVAFLPGPAQPTYYASKAFVRSLSRTLAYNLRNADVTVTALHPGVTRTGFFDASNASFMKNQGASPRSVAELGYKAMMAGKVEVTHGLWNKFLTNVFVRITPYRLHAPIVDRASEV